MFGDYRGIYYITEEENPLRVVGRKTSRFSVQVASWVPHGL